MSIGKNSIFRVQNAEKNGAAPIVNEAPDMENSTVIEPKKKAIPKKTATTAAKKKAAPAKTRAPKKVTPKNELTYCQIGEELPTYLL